VYRLSVPRQSTYRVSSLDGCRSLARPVICGVGNHDTDRGARTRWPANCPPPFGT
jgi:hypothetical protein